MFGRLFRRKTVVDEKAPDSADTPPAKPTLWQRITAFFVAFWNRIILLAAVIGAVICVRLAIGFWSTAEELQGGNEPLLFRLMAGAAAAAAVFLFWQVGRGARYLWHRRRQK